MKKVTLAFEVLLVIVPFLPLLVDPIFKTNMRASIMNVTLQWPLWVKVPVFAVCVLAYFYFWYALFKAAKE